MNAPEVFTPQPIMVSDSAANKVKDLLEEEGNFDLKLRVFVTGGGCSGFRRSRGPDPRHPWPVRSSLVWCLSGAAGDADHWTGEAGTDEPRDVLQGDQGVVDPHEAVAPALGHPLRDDACASPVADLREEVVRVEALTTKGEKPVS